MKTLIEIRIDLMIMIVLFVLKIMIIDSYSKFFELLIEKLFVFFFFALFRINVFFNVFNNRTLRRFFMIIIAFEFMMMLIVDDDDNDVIDFDELFVFDEII